MAIITDDETTYTNTYVDERVAELIYDLESLAPLTPRQRQKGKKGYHVKHERNQVLQGWESLALQEAIALMDRYPDRSPDEVKTYGTCLRQITALKKGLRHAAQYNLMDPGMVGRVNTLITLFGDNLSMRFQIFKVRQNQQQRAKVAERSGSKNRIQIDLQPFIIEAKTVLSDLDNLEKKDWQRVSCALALATGRRMAEIHCTAGFYYQDEYKVGFTGYCKGKGRKINNIDVRDYVFDIPTLVPAQLVVDGLQWLTDNKKRVDDPEMVNRRYSTALSKEVKADWVLSTKLDMTYHKFRGAYLRACMEIENVDIMDATEYAKGVLGDDDAATIRHYYRFTIKSGLTR